MLLRQSMYTAGERRSSASASAHPCIVRSLLRISLAVCISSEKSSTLMDTMPFRCRLAMSSVFRASSSVSAQAAHVLESTACDNTLFAYCYLGSLHTEGAALLCASTQPLAKLQRNQLHAWSRTLCAPFCSDCGLLAQLLVSVTAAVAKGGQSSFSPAVLSVLLCCQRQSTHAFCMSCLVIFL